MKHALVILLVLPLWLSHAQPLAGSYTVGGTTPDFVTLQDVGNALKTRGVSGPTFFNIRPGTYARNGGNNTVLVLDSIVAGLSSANRITFQPDAATGGTVDNVILQMNITNSSTADPVLVHVYLDHVTFHNLTFQEYDSSLHTFNFRFVQLQRNFYTGFPPVSGIVFDGCAFTGSNPFGTENGIELGQGVRDLTVRGNTFRRLLRGISGATGTGISQGTMLVEDNRFLAGWRSASGSGNQLGSAMEIFCQNLFVRRNIIDFGGSVNGGYHGLSLSVKSGTERIIVEQNIINGPVSAALYVGGQIAPPDSCVVANNIINATVYQVWANEPAYGISVQDVANARVLFNTMVLRGGGLVGLHVLGPDCVVLNNILIARTTGGFNIGYDQGNTLQSPNLRSDHNEIFMQPGGGVAGPLVIRHAVQYPSLSAYRTATGLDTNSISKDLDFVDSTDLHLTDCQSQDPDLKGIPVPGITVDIDGEVRSTTAPMIGADENGVRMLDMFADPFASGLSGTAFSVASGRFDNILFDGLAVPDYDNRQVRLYHNLGGPRSFVPSGTLSTGFKPNVVKFFDLDRDNHLDLIVGGDTTALKVFWGDGAGNFPSDTTIITLNASPFFSGGRVRSLDTGRVSFVVNSSTILLTEDDGFLPNTSYLAYLDNDNGRNLVHHVISRPGSPARPDTIPAVLTDFIVGNFDANGDPEVAALSVTPLPPVMYMFNDTNAQGGGGLMAYGARYSYQLGTGSSPGHASSIIMGDYDGDTDNDLITLGTFSSCLLIRNQGNFNFAPEPISVTGAQCLVRMDYENDGDLDFATLNERLETNGITVFLNDGTGHFTPKENCFFPFASGRPFGATASDFDQDGRTDIVVVSGVAPGVDSLFVLYNLGGGISHVPGEGTREIPTGFTLEQNYPNPFNPTTEVRFRMAEAGMVTLKVYDVLGREIAVLVNEVKQPGNYEVIWDGTGFASGVYFCRLQAGQFAQIRKMLLLR